MKRKASIEKRKEEESKELYDAVENGKVKKVKSLLKRGIADVDWRNEEEVNYSVVLCNFLISLFVYS